jgi:hypothetical protein
MPARVDTPCRTLVAPAPATRSPRRGVTSKQADVQRDGIAVKQVEVDLATGRIIIKANTAESAEFSIPLDTWLTNRARAS